MTVATRLPLGPVIVDLAGTSLSDPQRELLRHPLVGGVILFARNYNAPDQLAALCRDIHAVREPALLVAADHEGGRVQRFRSGFTAIPPMAALGLQWDLDPQAARRSADAIGYVIGCELRRHGVDLSFTPVLDVDCGESAVIGDRALHRDPEVVGELAAALVGGLRRAGMPGIGKHFPGHGSVAADSHVAVPVDARSLEEIRARDLIPFRRLARELGGVMPAHVLYDRCDTMPAGYSRFWLRRVLREELGFRGIVFSDDLSMAGARVAGDIVQRADAALAAGCDFVLVCNDSEAVRSLLDRWNPDNPCPAPGRLAALAVNRAAGLPATAEADRDYRAARDLVDSLRDIRGRG